MRSPDSSMSYAPARSVGWTRATYSSIISSDSARNVTRDSTQAVRSAPSSAADAYRTLGVKPSASDEEVKRAYREKAKSYHPDILRSQGASERKIAEATERESRTCRDQRRMQLLTSVFRNRAHGIVRDRDLGGLGFHDLKINS